MIFYANYLLGDNVNVLREIATHVALHVMSIHKIGLNVMHVRY